MNYGIKVSKQGFDVMNIDRKRTKKFTRKASLPHLLYALALPYLFGAKKQVKRYQIEASTLKERPVNSIYGCLHEASTLLEDLNTVAKYVEKCGNKNKLHKLWLDVRNHIRHDIREEFDNESDMRKNKRAQRLKLNPKLQTNIGFTIDLIKVGGITIKIQQINAYLKWAENIILSILNDAKRKGYIKSQKYVKL